MIFLRYNFRIIYEELIIILLPTKRDEIQFGTKEKMYNLTQLKTLKFRAPFETSLHYLQKKQYLKHHSQSSIYAMKVPHTTT